MTDRARVKDRMASVLGLPPERLGDGARLVDLVTESFLLVQLAVDLQEELDVQLGQEDLRDAVTVGDLVDRCLGARPDGRKGTGLRV